MMNWYQPAITLEIPKQNKTSRIGPMDPLKTQKRIFTGQKLTRVLFLQRNQHISPIRGTLPGGSFSYIFWDYKSFAVCGQPKSKTGSLKSRPEKKSVFIKLPGNISLEMEQKTDNVRTASWMHSCIHDTVFTYWTSHILSKHAAIIFNQMKLIYINW